MRIIQLIPQILSFDKYSRVHTVDGVMELYTHNNVDLAVQPVIVGTNAYISVWHKRQIDYIKKYNSMSAGLPMINIIIEDTHSPFTGFDLWFMYKIVSKTHYVLLYIVH